MHRAPREILGIAILILLPAVAARGQELMPGSSSAWSGFSARAESTPALLASAGSSYSLEIFGNGVPNVYGGWRTRIQALSGGGYYRFRTRVFLTDVASPRESVTILLRWRGSYGDKVAPDYVWQYYTQSWRALHAPTAPMSSSVCSSGRVDSFTTPPSCSIATELSPGSTARSSSRCRRCRRESRRETRCRCSRWTSAGSHC